MPARVRRAVRSGPMRVCDHVRNEDPGRYRDRSMRHNVDVTMTALIISSVSGMQLSSSIFCVCVCTVTACTAARGLVTGGSPVRYDRY